MSTRTQAINSRAKGAAVTVATSTRGPKCKIALWQLPKTGPKPPVPLLRLCGSALAYEPWTGYGWTAEMSVPAFCTLVLEKTAANLADTPTILVR